MHHSFLSRCMADASIRGLQRSVAHSAVGSLLVLLRGLAGTVALGSQLVEPASEWAKQVPREMRDLAPKLRELTRPVKAANEAAQDFARATDGEDTQPVEVVRTEVNDPYKSQIGRASWRERVFQYV